MGILRIQEVFLTTNMVNPFTQKPDPYPFKGGDASDYEVVIGKEDYDWYIR